MSLKEQLFYVVIEGKPEGPYTFAELEKLQLSSSDFIKPSDHKDYKELREIPALCYLLSLKHEATMPQYFASMDVRLLAWAIDGLLSFAACCVFIFLPILLFATTENKLYFTLLALLTIPMIQFIVTVFMEASSYQGSPGKILLGIKVSTTTGKPISFPHSLARNIFKITGFLSLGLGFFTGFFDRKQRCWHDKLAKTLVIKDRLV